MSGASAVEPTPAELDEGAISQAIVRGVLVGTIVVYGLLVVGGLLVGTSVGVAFLLALWPAFVAGPFFGGVAYVGGYLVRLEHSGRPEASADVSTQTQEELRSAA